MIASDFNFIFRKDSLNQSPSSSNNQNLYSHSP